VQTSGRNNQDTEAGGARRVLRNTAVLGVSKVLERAVGFVVAVLIASHLGADGLGVYAAAWAIYGLIAIAGDAGTTGYLTREISSHPARTGSYLVHLSVVAFVVSLVLMLAALIVTRHLGYSAALETSVSIVLLAILPRVLNSLQEGVFIAHGRVAFETLTRLCTSTAYVLVVAWLLGHGHGVPAVLRAFVASEYVVAVVYFVLISGFIARLPARFSWSLASRLTREVKAFAGSSAIAALFARPEILILSVLASERQTGLYSAAVRVAELPILIPEVFMANVFPLLSRAFLTSRDRFALWQRSSVRAMLAFSFPVAACFLAAGDEIIRVIYGNDFGAAAPVLRVLSFNVVFFSVIAVLWRSLVARRRQNVNLAVQSTSVLVRIVSGVALIVPLGAIGAAISGSGSSALHLCLLAGALARAGARVQIVRASWRFALAAAAMAVVTWVLGRWLPLPGMVLGGLAVYVVVSLAVGAITAEDRALWTRLRTAREPAGEALSRPAAMSSRVPTGDTIGSAQGAPGKDVSAQ
jgi:O-antigen/teichoic acid export membrane protein